MNHATSFRIQVRVQHCAPLIAEGLVAALRRHNCFEVVACEDRQAGGPGSPIVVADQGTALALLGGDASARPRVLIVATCVGERDVRMALDAGVQGFVLVDCMPDELYAGLFSIARGGRYLGSEAATRVADSLASESLTQRELDVLRLMVGGMSNKVIARELDIALGTVKAHARSVFGKLNAETRLQAAMAAAQRGLVPASHLFAVA